MQATHASVPQRVAPASIFQLATSLDDEDEVDVHGGHLQVLRRIFRITSGDASCNVGPALAAKYKVDGSQLVVSVTNMITGEQCWFNEVRSRKPQTFVPGSQPLDPTGGGGAGKCDFCDWAHLTAQDHWGRVEAKHAVTASNLFKYGEPAHGLALFKAHDPLSFTLEQLQDLLVVSDGWFAAAAEHHLPRGDGGSGGGAHNTPAAAPPSPGADAVDGGQHGPQRRQRRRLHGFFIWNALARAGASQFHGHAQLMATWVPVPAQAQLDLQSRLYSLRHPGRSYVADLLLAHYAAGLLRACAATPEQAALLRGSGGGAARAFLAASLSPVKDMEVLVAVRLAPSPADTLTPAQAAAGSQAGQPLQQESSRGIGLSDPAFCRALHAALRALLCTLGVESFNVGILNVPCGEHHDDSGSDPVELPITVNGVWEHGRCAEETPGTAKWMLARVVSRGRMSQPASDFGCLEVIGGASIGHTDPHRVIAAVEQQLGACMCPVEGLEPS